MTLLKNVGVIVAVVIGLVVAGAITYKGTVFEIEMMQRGLYPIHSVI